MSDTEPMAVRVVVDRADNPRGRTAVGSYFDVIGSRLYLPPGGTFNVYAMNATFGVLALRLGPQEEGGWLDRKPWISSPDPGENIVMRLDRVPVSAITYPRDA